MTHGTDGKLYELCTLHQICNFAVCNLNGCTTSTVGFDRSLVAACRRNSGEVLVCTIDHSEEAPYQALALVPTIGHQGEDAPHQEPAAGWGGDV